MLAPSWPSVSVVIPMFNAEATIGEQLEALAAQSYPGKWEVVVADNGSTDASCERAQRWQARLPSLVVVDASAQRGSSYARNLGVEVATGPIILMCDADDVVGPGWISALVEGLRTADVVRGSLDYATLNSDLVNAWFRPLRLSHRRNELRGHIAVPGGNFGTTRDTYRALGGWSRHDYDFSVRAQASDFELGVAPDAVVMVRRPSDLRSLAAKAFYGGTIISDAEIAEPNLRLGRATLAGMVVQWVGWMIVNLPLALVSRRARGRWIRVVALGMGWASRWIERTRAFRTGR